MEIFTGQRYATLPYDAWVLDEKKAIVSRFARAGEPAPPGFLWDELTHDLYGIHVVKPVKA